MARRDVRPGPDPDLVMALAICRRGIDDLLDAIRYRGLRRVSARTLSVMTRTYEARARDIEDHHASVFADAAGVLRGVLGRLAVSRNAHDFGECRGSNGRLG